MRALPEIQRRRPEAHVVVAGGDDVSYGSRPRGGRSWRQTLLDEVGGSLDASRVHFLGRVPFDTFVKALQVSSAHVYLTYPFVLSWSMLDAMAAGCAVVGSGTPPVREVIRDGENGMLVDFFDTAGIAERVELALGDRKLMEPIREKARQSIVERYDLATVCLPRQVRMIESMAAGKQRPERDDRGARAGNREEIVAGREAGGLS
jgi:glycosyltransferase involved in cell wall biosynthesis